MSPTDRFPSRMPIWKSVDPIRRRWLYWLCAVDIGYGGINVFGVRAELPWQILLGSILPLWTWYALLPIAGLLILFGWSVRGSMLGTFAWGAMTAANFATILSGTAYSLGGVVTLIGWTGLHVQITYNVSSGLDRRRENVQRLQRGDEPIE